MEKGALLALQSTTELGERRAEWLLLLLAGNFLPMGTGNPCTLLTKQYMSWIADRSGWAFQIVSTWNICLNMSNRLICDFNIVNLICMNLKDLIKTISNTCLLSIKPSFLKNNPQMFCVLKSWVVIEIWRRNDALNNLSKRFPQHLKRVREYPRFILPFSLCFLHVWSTVMDPIQNGFICFWSLTSSS